MTVGELRTLLEDVPDDTEVEVGSTAGYSGVDDEATGLFENEAGTTVFLIEAEA